MNKFLLDGRIFLILIVLFLDYSEILFASDGPFVYTDYYNIETDTNKIAINLMIRHAISVQCEENKHCINYVKGNFIADTRRRQFLFNFAETGTIWWGRAFSNHSSYTQTEKTYTNNQYVQTKMKKMNYIVIPDIIWEKLENDKLSIIPAIPEISYKQKFSSDLFEKPKPNYHIENEIREANSEYKRNLVLKKYSLTNSLKRIKPITLKSYLNFSATSLFYCTNAGPYAEMVYITNNIDSVYMGGVPYYALETCIETSNYLIVKLNNNEYKEARDVPELCFIEKNNAFRRDISVLENQIGQYKMKVGLFESATNNFKSAIYFNNDIKAAYSNMAFSFKKLSKTNSYHFWNNKFLEFNKE